jgi:hypothetical protein
MGGIADDLLWTGIQPQEIVLVFHPSELKRQNG